jgi:hypothetical protein
MIPYEELDRALARWRARSQGGAVEAAPEVIAEAEAAVVDGEATPLPIRAEELGSVPNQVAPGANGEGATGEIDVNELETYEEQ